MISLQFCSCSCRSSLYRTLVPYFLTYVKSFVRKKNNFLLSFLRIGFSCYSFEEYGNYTSWWKKSIWSGRNFSFSACEESFEIVFQVVKRLMPFGFTVVCEADEQHLFRRVVKQKLGGTDLLLSPHRLPWQ